MATALVFNITGDKRKKLLFLFLQYDIAAVEVPPSDHNRPLGHLLGKAGCSSTPTLDAPFSDEMLVLDGLTPQQFHGLLNGMQMLQAQVVYKAVTTEHNLSWTPAQLHRELVAEHAVMTK